MELNFSDASNQTNLNQLDMQAVGLEILDVWERMFYMGIAVQKFHTPILCFVGSLGNILSLLVFLMDKKYRRLSSSYYLSALAVSDTGYLFSLLLVWLETTVGNVITSAIVCPMIMYIGQVTCFVTVYLTVAFSIQRYIVVYFPLSRVQHCAKRKAKITISVIVPLGLLIFSYVWIIAEVIQIQRSNGYKNMCSVSERYYKFSEIANYIDSIVTMIVPFFIIAYFNVKTAIKVVELRKERRIITVQYSARAKRRDVMKTSQQNIVSRRMDYEGKNYIQTVNISPDYVDTFRVRDKLVCKISIKSPHRRNEYSDVRVTKTLLLVSSVFLGLNLPLHIIRCAQFLQIAHGTPFGSEILQGLLPWANMLFNTNFAVNMVLYCVFGRNFRNSLRNVLRQIIRK